MTIMAPSDELELMHMVATQAVLDDGPSAVRYPRGESTGLELPERGTPIPIGHGRVLREGTSVAILSLGTRLAESLRAADELAARGFSCTVADARFAKPFDAPLVERLAREHAVLLIIEEGSIGGFGAIVLQHLAQRGLLDGGVKVRSMTLPDRFIDHGTPVGQIIEAGLGAKDIVATALGALGHDVEARTTTVAVPRR